MGRPQNRQWILKSHPVGTPTKENLELVSKPVRELKDGEILIKVHYLSVDPYQRGRMNPGPSYAPGVGLGEVMIGGGVGSVAESKNSDYPVGSIVKGTFGWQEYAISDGENTEGLFNNKERVTIVSRDNKLSHYQGVLGMPGATAYYGFLKIIEPEAGKTLFVTGAAGAVGSLVGQIGKLKGLRVIGSAGSQKKLDYLKDLGFDGTINYKGKNTMEVFAEIQKIAPEGIDYMFDNTGGPVSDAVLLAMNNFGRVSVCGQIARYNATEMMETSVPVRALALVKQIRIEGFIVYRWLPDWSEGINFLAKEIKAGRLKVHETVTDGIENAYDAFLGFFTGKNTGKQIVKFSDPPARAKL